MKHATQLRIVCEALLVNGPGAGRRMDVMSGVRSIEYHPPDGGEPVTYTLFPFKWDRGLRKHEPGDVYRIGYIGTQPSADIITDAIKANGFQPYTHWYPQRGR